MLSKIVPERVLAERHSIQLGESDFQAIADALDGPANPSETVRDDVREQRRFIQK